MVDATERHPHNGLNGRAGLYRTIPPPLMGRVPLELSPKHVTTNRGCLTAFDPEASSESDAEGRVNGTALAPPQGGLGCLD